MDAWLTPARVALRAVVAVLVVAVAWLALAFWRSDLEWSYVAGQSRVGAPLAYRIAGVWGGMEGSLLLFTAIVGVVAVLATRGRPAPATTLPALVTVLALATVDLAVASPFRRERIPPTVGFGLNPILEHPAMVIHPPLLYCGLAATFGAALRAVDAGWRAPRSWLLAALGLLAAAMTLGGAWSYMEQGWGGYWAWDPVENTSLLVWLAALGAIHLAPRARPRTADATAAVPWLLALLGAALVRSGRTPSVHAFARQLTVGWALFGLFLASTAALAWTMATGRAARPDPAARPHDRRDQRPVTVALVTAAALVVLVGTLAPVVIDLTGGRATAVPSAVSWFRT